ncbi:MAG: hypothetical protein DRH08_03170 [Deltaproteobacteria bacterium]|nr:MAG: hypothetical protein DRH08_03170 [Deltaproteobacteria bacterium]
MIFIGEHTFEIIEKPNKLLAFREIDRMGPYAHGDFSPAIFSAYRDLVLQSLQDVTKKVFNEDYILTSNRAMVLESLAKQYEFKDLVAWFKRYWEDMDNLALMNDFAGEVKERPNMEHENMKLIRAFKDEIELTDEGPDMRRARISYLEDENTNLSSQIRPIEADIQQLEDRDTEEWLIELRKEFSGYEKLTGKHRSNAITIAHLKGQYDEKKTVVTDDMIALAKKVPFNKILKLEVVGNRAKALCPFHNENTPSFVVYGDTNRGHCHGCGKNVDTIQYLVEIKKINFNEAVLMLLSY